MTRTTRAVAWLAATVLIGTVAAGGCGVGPGEASEGEANLRVTRDFGQSELVDATLAGPTESDTVVRFLDNEADIETSYGGNFVDSIEGLGGSTINGGAEDWFFFVNGYYSDVGAGETPVLPGDRIWWDYRRWAEAYRVPAVVGSWPEPFLHGTGGQPRVVVVECLTPQTEVCNDVTKRLDDVGVEATAETVDEPVPHPDDLRVLVGPWGVVRDDPAAAQLEKGPGTSGVYANVVPCGGRYGFEILGSDGRPRVDLSVGGLVAAVRDGDDQATWLVTATADDMLDHAASLLDAETLRDRYAVAIGLGAAAQSVPASEGLPALGQGGFCR